MTEPIDAAADVARLGAARPLGDVDAQGGGQNRGVALCRAPHPPAQCRHPEGRARRIADRDRGPPRPHVDAVKAHLARGRAHLREINAHARPGSRRAAGIRRGGALCRAVQPAGLGRPAGARWPTTSSSISRCIRFASAGADVGLFFTLYAKIDGCIDSPRLGSRSEVIAVFEDRADPKPSYIMWLEWRDGRISFIHDYRYVRYVTADADADAGVGGQARGRRRRSVMPGAVLLDRRARQCASSSMARPRASGRHPPKGRSTGAGPRSCR